MASTSSTRRARGAAARSTRASSISRATLGELGVWVRLHYVYPYPHVDAVIPLMAEGKILPYLDIPFQHAQPAVLRRMRRPAAQAKTLERIRAWRAICPDLTIRSTFIVGFPGETEEEFQMLLDWLDEAELDRVGCFRYEPVAGAAANGVAHAGCRCGQGRALASPHGGASRRSRRGGSSARSAAGSTSSSTRSGRRTAKGRSKGDAPEIDGAVHVASRRPLRLGEIATVKIERADAYDLHGTAVGF